MNKGSLRVLIYQEFIHCLCHPIQMVGIETMWELHTLTVTNSCVYIHMYILCTYLCQCTYQCFREEIELFSPLVHPGFDGSHVPGACYGGDIHLR